MPGENVLTRCQSGTVEASIGSRAEEMELAVMRSETRHQRKKRVERMRPERMSMSSVRQLRGDQAKKPRS